MGNDCGKTNENIYFKCRKEAALYDKRLSSRESAADLLGVSPSSLADYELGNTKVVPVDKVVLMADLYGAPELMTMYCKHDCPIGPYITVATDVLSLDTIVLKLLNGLEEGKTASVKKRLVEIAVTEGLSGKNVHSLDDILTYLDSLEKSIEELKLLCRKMRAMVDGL